MARYLTDLDNFTVERLPEENFAAFLPGLPETPLDTAAVAAHIAACREKLREAILHPYAALDVHRLHALMIDRLVARLFRENVPGADGSAPVTLVAVGGYGRSEMSFHSDIDLLFLHDLKNPDAAKTGIEKILYALWDAKLDVGHAVRTPADCRDIIGKDHTVFTNLLEARRVAGNADLYRRLETDIATALGDESARRRFIEDKLKERDERHAKYGGSVYLLEPNLKEGKGGLRDLHLLRWLGRAAGAVPSFKGLHQADFATEEESKVLRFSLRFFLQIRNRLHLMQGKKSDQISFDAQEQLAKALGFLDSPGGILAVERFMQSYYAVASQVQEIAENTVQKILTGRNSPVKALWNRLTGKNLDENFRIADGRLLARDENLFDENPALLMRLFRHVQNTGLDVHFVTKEAVVKALPKVDDAFRSDPKIAALFREMMADLPRLDKALFAMHQTHFFDAYIPEFRKLRNRVQHDLYHVYTVDTHSIFAIGEIAKLARGDYAGKFDAYAASLARVPRRDILSMGLLFHDVGKGEGGNHSVVGAEIAGRVAERLGYSSEDRATIEFLVLSHLTMPHLSQRRDLEDAHLIREFAKTAGSPERLDMLVVLTWADIRAVSAEAWSDWKGSLLLKLHDKTMPLLRDETLLKDYALRRADDVRKAVLSRMAGSGDAGRIDEFLRGISPRYLLAHGDDEICSHFRLIREHREENFFCVEKQIPPGDVSELLVYTYNNPRVLPLVTGVMLAHGANILDMEVFTLSQGGILVKMRAQTEYRASLSGGGLTAKIEKSLRDVFTGAHRIDELIARRKRPSYMAPKKPVQRAKSKVDIDNDVSPYFTIIDIYAHDRLGLLYDIIKCLGAQGCYVEVSKISTKVEQAVDSFYVKDIFGHKITSKPKLAEIKKALMDVIEKEAA